MRIPTLGTLALLTSLLATPAALAVDGGPIAGENGPTYVLAMEGMT